MEQGEVYGRCPWSNALPDKAAREKWKQAMEETEVCPFVAEMLLTATLGRGEGV